MASKTNNYKVFARITGLCPGIRARTIKYLRRADRDIELGTEGVITEILVVGFCKEKLVRILLDEFPNQREIYVWEDDIVPI
jgi:hypothetical protein